MKKFLAIVKREYIQRVRSKMFIVSTVLLPAVMSLFGIVPADHFEYSDASVASGSCGPNWQDVWGTEAIARDRLFRSGLEIRQFEPAT